MVGYNFSEAYHTYSVHTAQSIDFNEQSNQIIGILSQ